MKNDTDIISVVRGYQNAAKAHDQIAEKTMKIVEFLHQTNPEANAEAIVTLTQKVIHANEFSIKMRKAEAHTYDNLIKPDQIHLEQL